MSHNKPGKNVTDAIPYDSLGHRVDSEPIPSSEPSQVTQDTRLFYPRQNENTTLTVDQKYLDANEYLMTHDERGKALIINNTNFSGGLGDREGSEVDATAMYSRLSDLGFDIELLNNASAAGIMEKLKYIAAEDHSDADCFACVILTHGDADGLHGTSGRLKETDIMDCFNADKCPSLAFKPKIFIFQVRKLSNRHTEKGSVYIQALSQEMMSMKSDEDFITVLTRVNRIVAHKFEHMGDDPRYQGMKQMPCFVSRLTKALRFREK
ncbi:hypothetical protein KUTeg_016821 [Tegillarca granosa]|uniref:Caspase-3 n=1 Tax=Tegillarca granosa TaxID=220873 RepID=A0ABQ9EM19_TEGGR|nr:hypothetical protein KUTeg_016821 [Tegillarca granosa]